MQRKILIVDDEPAILEVVKWTLETLAGWSLLTATCGMEGVALAARHAPDAILLDVMMPKVDGYQTLKALRSEPATKDIPVLFLTAKAGKLNGDRLASEGAQGVILKPFDPKTLAPEVAQALGWKE